MWGKRHCFDSLQGNTLRAVGFSYAKRERNHWEQPSAFPSSVSEFVTPHVMHLMSISFSLEVFVQKNAIFSWKALAEKKSKALWAAHGWKINFCLCGKTCLCAKTAPASLVRSFSWKSIHFHMKCFAFVLRGQGKKQLWSGSKVCIWAKWPIRLALFRLL